MSDAVPRKTPQHFVETDLDGEAVIMNVENGRFHALKETGLVIWRLIDGRRSVADIQAELLKAYDVDEGLCRGECEKFLMALKRAGFVEGV